MDRTLRLLATIFLLAALMLSLFVSLSLPYLPALDITRVHLASGSGVAGIDTLSELRVSTTIFSRDIVILIVSASSY
jgi:hypothetical protein